MGPGPDTGYPGRDVSNPDPIVDPEAFAGAADPTPGLTLASSSAPEEEFENTLRPRSFDEFIGQHRVVDNLRIALRAAQARKRPSNTSSCRDRRGWARPAWRASWGANCGASSTPPPDRPWNDRGTWWGS